MASFLNNFNVFPQTYGESCGRKDQWYYDHECKPYSTSQVRQYTTPYSCVPVDPRVDDTATLGSDDRVVNPGSAARATAPLDPSAKFMSQSQAMTCNPKYPINPPAPPTRNAVAARSTMRLTQAQITQMKYSDQANPRGQVNPRYLQRESTEKSSYGHIPGYCGHLPGEQFRFGS